MLLSQSLTKKCFQRVTRCTRILQISSEPHLLHLHIPGVSNSITDYQLSNHSNSYNKKFTYFLYIRIRKHTHIHLYASQTIVNS